MQQSRLKHPRRAARQVLAPGALAVAVAAAVAGCGGTPGFEGPWAAEFEQAYDQATTDFQREVFKDGQLTRAEYDEATARYVQCMEDRGFAVSVTDVHGINNYSYTGGNEGSQVSDECRTELSPIEVLYGAMLGNPENRHPPDLFAECFVRHGLAEPEFTGSGFEEWMAGADVPGAPDDGAARDPAFEHCLVDPSW
nr:hypothetical protein [Actinomycetales bacterium]